MFARPGVTAFSDDLLGMDRLAETIVAWHNRHPLARRIAVRDVHTIGVVALPFMRSTPAHGPSDAKEPVLTDEVVPPPGAAGEANVNTALNAVLTRSPPPGSTLKGLDGLSRLLALLPGKSPPLAWAAFDEPFLPGLKTRAIERFALAHGYPEPPVSRDAMPWRVVQVKADPGEGWPFELYLLSAGVDAGPARTRVLAGRGNPALVIGRRTWDPVRLGVAALTLAAVVALPLLGTWWWGRSSSEAVSPPQDAASAAATGVPVAPLAGSAVPLAPADRTQAASAPPGAAEAGSAAGSAASSASAPSPDGEDAPDIRPRLVPNLPSRDGKPRPPLRGSSEAAGGEPASTAQPAEAAERRAAPSEPPRAAATGSAAPASTPAASLPNSDPRLARMTQPGSKSVVALVGPPASKAEAQAQLQKMQAGLTGMVNDPASLQAQVIETPDGWRATVWPFASREQAQLINAVLVARGLKTKAVDF